MKNTTADEIDLNDVENFLEWATPTDLMSYLLVKTGSRQDVASQTREGKAPHEFDYVTNVPGLTCAVECGGQVYSVKVSGHGNNYLESVAFLCAGLLCPERALGFPENALSSGKMKRFIVAPGGQKTEIKGSPTRSWLQGPSVEKLGLS